MHIEFILGPYLSMITIEDAQGRGREIPRERGRYRQSDRSIERHVKMLKGEGGKYREREGDTKIYLYMYKDRESGV